MAEKMLSRVLILFVFTPLCAVVFAQSYDSWALGPSVGFYVPDGSWARHFSNGNPAAGIGINGDIRFDLGSAGEIAYAPTIDFWLRHSNWRYDDNGHIDDVKEVSLTDYTIHLNLFAAKYYPPLSDIVKPYAGLGIFAIPIYYHKEYVDYYDDHPTYSNGGTTQAGLGADIYAGSEFRISSRMSPYFEIRYS
ncbi:MAG: outer membrane beta-barrel protein, partial [Fibrobacterota bacterium]